MKLHEQMQIKEQSYKGKQVNGKKDNYLFLASFQPLLANRKCK